ncbi:MAG: hypothetical protein AAF367_07155 [Pseudomonadota bacterium]
MDMTNTSEKWAVAPSAMAPSVVVTMKVGPEGGVLVRSVEMIRVQSRIRFSFPPEAQLSGVLVDHAARSVMGLVRDALEQRGMLAMPDYILRLDDLVLADCSVITAKVRDGGEQVMVRFNRFYGTFLTFFAKDTLPHESLLHGEADQALELIEQAYMPLMDFAEHVRVLEASGALAADEQANNALLAIKSQIEDMRFYRQIVRQYIDGSVTRRPRAMISTETTPRYRLN